MLSCALPATAAAAASGVIKTEKVQALAAHLDNFSERIMSGLEDGPGASPDGEDNSQSRTRGKAGRPGSGSVSGSWLCVWQDASEYCCCGCMRGKPLTWRVLLLWLHAGKARGLGAAEGEVQYVDVGVQVELPARPAGLSVMVEVGPSFFRQHL